jgi:hypothetical protein
MRARFLFEGSIVAAVAAVTTMLPARPARACGGCFSPPKQVTVVTGHRMAFSISPEQSVLWDQIQYSGAPQDFAWILPVHAGAQIQLSHDEFFAALDALSSPVITGPTPSCGNGGSGFACGGFASSSNTAGESSGGGGVQVLSQSVVGPYDTVTVRSTNPNALYDWLVANGYDIPASTRTVIDQYVKEAFDFIALRLAPGQGVQAMQPVRVVTPGAGLSLPLRMVAAGVGANVGITLYMIGDGRYQAQNFPNGVVDATKLVWEHAQSQSNYQALAAQVMQGAGGHTWLTEFAEPTGLGGTPSQYASGGGYSCGSVGGGVSYYGGGGQSLAALYFAQCLCAGSTLCPQQLVFSADASPDAGASIDAADDASEAAASNDGGNSGNDGGAVGDAATDADSGGLIPPPDAACGANACNGFDDLDVAAVGLDPNNTWVTRMRAVLPSSALASDLVLEAASPQTQVSNQLTASVYDDPTYDPCPSSSGGCATADGLTWLDGRTVVAGGLAFLGASLVRRRRAIKRAARRPRD